MDKIERVSRTLAYQGTILKIYKDHMRFPDGVEGDWDLVGVRVEGRKRPNAREADAQWTRRCS